MKGINPDKYLVRSNLESPRDWRCSFGWLDGRLIHRKFWYTTPVGEVVGNVICSRYRYGNEIDIERAFISSYTLTIRKGALLVIAKIHEPEYLLISLKSFRFYVVVW
ncbi:hypothetical protein TNCV_1116611 [Trichonephila clavipes]|nr:hypothetical protein TNCV_1116611 [Trichonephila clavipes]